MEPDFIEISKASVHNMKGISLKIPRNRLVVVTGLSGSGKSSLAFDTIFAEAQRRYMDTLSTYAKQYIGVLERPDVESIDGLSPTIAIEQKSTNRNPRSTVGTVTEILDSLRLLYARAAKGYSPVTGREMVKYSEPQIVELITKNFTGRKCIVLAPLVKGRKGNYRELFANMLRRGYTHIRIDGEIGEIGELSDGLDRYKNHDIELVVDKLIPDGKDEKRIRESVSTALNYGKGSLAILDMASGKVSHYSRSFICPDSGVSLPEPAPHTFSFNSPQGACPHCRGLGSITTADISKIIPDPKKSIAEGGIESLGVKRENGIFTVLEGVAARYGFSLHQPIREISEEAMNVILYGTEELISVKSFGGNEMCSFQGILARLEHKEDESEYMYGKREMFSSEVVCPECGGTRLKKESLLFKIDGKDIAEVSQMDITDLYEWVCSLPERLDKRQLTIASDIIKELKDRISFLIAVGLDYLTLARSSRSLSGGESQRIRLATQIGSKLVNVLYILDEPSIGLHQSDNRKLIASLKALRDEGNSVMVVEHDEEMIRSADWLVDLGPGAGEKGGELLFSGPPSLVGGNDGGAPVPSGAYPTDGRRAEGFTAAYLLREKSIEVPALRRKGNGKFLSLFGACGNNLKNVSISIPLGCFIGVSGVSGSGKSSLILDTLKPILMKRFYRALEDPLPYEKIEGMENIDKVVEVDQSPVGRSPRSNPATYTDVWTDIRKLFESTPDAKVRGFKSGKFSFNMKGGRCETCKGAGVELIEMNFLPSVNVTCKECNGKRFKPEVLAVKYKGKNINDILEMTIAQAVVFFEHIPSIYQRLKALDDVGLGYVHLGQACNTLSGGENQRVKLAAELSRKSTGNTLYLLDEPTTGLHTEDIKILLGVLQKLVDQGNTVIVIEHNLDVLKSVDYLFDLGPRGGREGGRILCEGTPEAVAESPESVTAPFLKECLGNGKK